MIDFAIAEGAGGLGYITFAESGEARGPIAKFLTEEKLSQIKKIAGISDGDAVFFASDQELPAAKIAGKVRDKLGADLEINR